MKYKEPEMEIQRFQTEDMVRTSGDEYHDPNNPGEGWSDTETEDW